MNSGHQQASSGIHLVPHSLPSAAASLSYPLQPSQQQQPVQQQPVYQQAAQQQPSVPIVYPVSSMAQMIQQQAPAPSAGANPASLAMPAIATQPPSVSAASTLPANLGQSFLQQAAPQGMRTRPWQRASTSRLALQRLTLPLPPSQVCCSLRRAPSRRTRPRRRVNSRTSTPAFSNSRSSSSRSCHR